MTHETNVRAYKNIPFEYRLKKDGYYDITGTLKGGWSVFNLEFQAFNGLNMSYEQLSGSPMVVKANAGQLPDLTNINGVTGCLKEVGVGPGIYTNYTINGSPIIDIYTGIVSNLSGSNYLSAQDLGLVTPDNNKTWEVVVKFTTGTSIPSNEMNVFCTSGRYSSYILQLRSNNLYAFLSSNGSSWDIANGAIVMSITANTTYKIKIEFTGTEYNWYSYENDNWVLKYTVTSSVSVYAGARYVIGDGFVNGGIVDLSETYMKVNGQIAWTPAVGNGYVAKVSADNFTLFGSPTIDSDKVVSGFSTTSGLRLPETTPSTITDLDIIFKGNLTNVSANSVIFAHASSNQRYVGIRGTGKFAMYIGSWVEGTTALSTNTEYWFRVIKDGNNYKGYLLVDNNYTLDTLPALNDWSQEFSTTTNIFNGYLFDVGYNSYSTGEYFKGSIDLKGCSVNINGSEFWNPFVKKMPVEGLLPSGVTDDGSAQTWNLFYNNGDYRLNTASTMTGYTWVGSVAIPAHSSPTPAPTPTKSYDVIGTLTNDNGVYSGFSDNDYIQLSTDLLVPGNTFVFKFTTGSDLTDFQNILAPDNWFELYVENDNLYAWIESEGGPISCGSVSTETTYWAKVETTSDSVTLSYSTDGVTYTGAVSSHCVKGTIQQFNVGHGIFDYANRNWSGSIDITNSCIKNSSGTVIW